MDNVIPPNRTAVLVFADSQQRDLRRRGFGPKHSGLLALPRVQSLADVDVHWFTDQSVASRRPFVHRQRGSTFGRRLENAVEDLVAAGYERIVIVGRDCPQMTSEDVRGAIESLQSHRLVIGPDQRGGCWLIGFHAADRKLLRDITWQQDTDAAELIRRFGTAETLLLEQKYDIDHAGDLALLARVFAPAAWVVNLAPPTARWFRPRPADRLLSAWLDLPPPAAAA